MPALSSGSLRAVLGTRRMFLCVYTGFSAGLPIFLVLQMVPAWLRAEGVGLADIALLSLASMPYALRFLWAPLLDRYRVFGSAFDRRRGWLLLTQVLLFLSIGAIGGLEPTRSLNNVGMLVLLVAFFNASQEVVADGYRRELLPAAELGLGTSLYSQAMRLAGLIPGGLALILADYLPWSAVYWIVAAFMLVGMLATLLVRPPAVAEPPSLTLRDAVVEPFRDLRRRFGGGPLALVLLFLTLYKLGDYTAGLMSMPFYIDLGFSLTEVGLVVKNASLAGTVTGGLIGGVLLLRISINRALWLFGAAQMLSILALAALAAAGPKLWLLLVAVLVENLGVGLGQIALATFVMNCANVRFAGTQIALLNGLAAIPRILATAAGGRVVEWVGWTEFFLLCTLAALPGMLLLLKVAPWSGGLRAAQPQTA